MALMFEAGMLAHCPPTARLVAQTICNAAWPGPVVCVYNNHSDVLPPPPTDALYEWLLARLVHDPPALFLDPACYTDPVALVLYTTAVRPNWDRLETALALEWETPKLVDQPSGHTTVSCPRDLAMRLRLFTTVPNT